MQCWDVVWWYSDIKGGVGSYLTAFTRAALEIGQIVDFVVVGWMLKVDKLLVVGCWRCMVSFHGCDLRISMDIVTTRD